MTSVPKRSRTKARPQTTAWTRVRLSGFGHPQRLIPNLKPRIWETSLLLASLFLSLFWCVCVWVCLFLFFFPFPFFRGGLFIFGRGLQNTQLGWCFVGCVAPGLKKQQHERMLIPSARPKTGGEPLALPVARIAVSP